MHRFFTVLGLALMLASISMVPNAAAQEPDTPLLSGRFYTQGSGKPGLGFAVTDDVNGAFYSTYLQLGGPSVIGYPVSQRFMSGGLATQVFERQVLQATPNGVDLLATFDLMSTAGLDPWLSANYAIPPLEPLLDPLSVLDTSPTLKAAYYNVPDAQTLNGLPTAPVTDFVTVRTLRTQRAAIYESLSDAAGATYASVGDIVREAGLFPATVFQPQTLAQAAAGSAPGGSNTPPESTAPEQAPPLQVAATPSDTQPVSGATLKLYVKVADSSGNPVSGAKVLVIVHYPLKTPDEAYAVDGIFFGPETDYRGNTVIDIALDPAVPAGTAISYEVSAVYPPSIGKVDVDSTIY